MVIDRSSGGKAIWDQLSVTTGAVMADVRLCT